MFAQLTEFMKDLTKSRNGISNREIAKSETINYKWTLSDPQCVEEYVNSPICGGYAFAAYANHGSINSSCQEGELREIMRTHIMSKYPELFEGCIYESIVL